MPRRLNKRVKNNVRWKFIDWLTLIFLIIGGLNYGLIALFSFNIVKDFTTAVGASDTLTRIIYGFIGLDAFWFAYLKIRHKILGRIIK